MFMNARAPEKAQSLGSPFGGLTWTPCQTPPKPCARAASPGEDESFRELTAFPAGGQGAFATFGHRHALWAYSLMDGQVWGILTAFKGCGKGLSVSPNPAPR